MKLLLTLILILTLTSFATAQRQITYGYTKIKKSQFDSCGKTPYLFTNSLIKKQGSKLTIPISSKPSKVFKDDNSVNNYHEFEYLGDIRGTKISLIKRTDYNCERYYLINHMTGAIDTLIGKPIFGQNMIDFTCINNPGTDEKQQIQIGELKNGSVNTIVYLKSNASIFFVDISCVNHNSILTKDNKGNYWKLSFEVGDE